MKNKLYETSNVSIRTMDDHIYFKLRGRQGQLDLDEFTPNMLMEILDQARAIAHQIIRDNDDTKK